MLSSPLNSDYIFPYSLFCLFCIANGFACLVLACIFLVSFLLIVLTFVFVSVLLVFSLISSLLMVFLVCICSYLSFCLFGFCLWYCLIFK